MLKRKENVYFTFNDFNRFSCECTSILFLFYFRRRWLYFLDFLSKYISIPLHVRLFSTFFFQKFNTFAAYAPKYYIRNTCSCTQRASTNLQKLCKNKNVDRRFFPIFNVKNGIKTMVIINDDDDVTS